MTEEEKKGISKSLESAIRRAVLEDDLASLLPVLHNLPEEKKEVCRKIVQEERERKKQLIKQGIIENE